ncbi:MAG: hypothetical protein IT275_02080 [Chitinophagales bacterium]|nr:hypothetical protein [Chitinophagales bacterium]HMV13916.1 hypothetical protein [Chitinophagales bacterium]HMW11770.1 hypothetical protein [Chitinophagales bacterium]HMX59345.1 hypothetical protein [Chitinophagales bacterium]HMY23435.1 hypothetical protein [Chitinophagales bacterium]
MKTKNVITAIIINALGISIAFAGGTMPHAKNRQIHQQERIYNGVKSGELTKKEAIKLEIQQNNIQQAKQAAKADGIITAQEKAKIEYKQDKASNNIYEQKHDTQNRP